jgi:hypothetical protein
VRNVDRDASNASNVVGRRRAPRPSHRRCRHRCERPLRMDAPSTGWVTVLAGLLARGSSPLVASGLPGFPVAVNGRGLAAHSCGGSHGLPRSGARVPSFVLGVPRNQHGENVARECARSQAGGSRDALSPPLRASARAQRQHERVAVQRCLRIAARVNPLRSLLESRRSIRSRRSPPAE